MTKDRHPGDSNPRPGIRSNARIRTRPRGFERGRPASSPPSHDTRGIRTHARGFEATRGFERGRPASSPPSRGRHNTSNFFSPHPNLLSSYTQKIQAQTSSGVAQWLACWAHNPKVRGSKPRSATFEMRCVRDWAAWDRPCPMCERLVSNTHPSSRPPRGLIRDAPSATAG